MLIAAKLHPSEFIDRYIVYVTRARNLSVVEPAIASEAELWITANSQAFEALKTTFPSLSKTLGELHAVHARLWVLEDRVRRCDSKVSAVVFGAAAREVFRLNDQRHGLKRTIDRICGVPSNSLRVYATSATQGSDQSC